MAIAVSDASFFQEALNYAYPGLHDVEACAKKKDYHGARHAFALFLRASLDDKAFFTIPYEIPENVFKLPGESDADACERMKKHILVSVGVPCDYGVQNKIDWFANPTSNKYKEWTWQLSRHNEIKMLAHQYRLTGDESYPPLAAELLASWMDQAVFPGDVIGYETLCWRTIECGIRMGANWPYIIFTFLHTPAFTDDLLTDLFKSIYEHGNRLSHNFTKANWLIMEMNGLAHIAMLYPFYAKAETWKKQSFDALERELDLQIYPDGFQFELTTGYHDVVINNYQRMIEVARAFHVSLPQTLLDKLEHAIMLFIKLMMPDGRLPDINDGKWSEVKELITPKRRIFPHNQLFQWVCEGTGDPPSFKSVALDYSGFAVFRTGWTKQDSWVLFDSAPFGRAHQHEDKLSVLLYAKEKVLLTEAGNYAYDSSAMRTYVLSTRAHNTALVDGLEQNRREGYTWKDEDIRKKSGMRCLLSPTTDCASGVYDEGYGEGKQVHARHKRSVYFIKNDNPVLVVDDCFLAEEEHTFTMLWHVDDDLVNLSERGADFKNLTVCVSDNDQLTDVYGSASPVWQGFVAYGDALQGQYRPVHCLEVQKKGKRARVVTVFQPKGKDGVVSVEKDEDAIILTYACGRKEKVLTF